MIFFMIKGGDQDIKALKRLKELLLDRSGGWGGGAILPSVGFQDTVQREENGR